MPLSTAQQVRLRIQDQPLLADATYAGDGTALSFALPNRNLTSASAYVPLGGTAWSGTGASFNATGSVAFSGVISANSAFRVTYVYSTFSDDEIDTMITAGGGVNGAAIEAVTTLMFDGLRRASWGAPDGTRYDDTAAMTLLKDLYDRLKLEQDEAAVADGGIAEWGYNQGNY